MMTKRSLKIALIILIATVWSCGENDVQTFPSTFVKTRVASTGKYRVFTSKGELTNTLMIRHRRAGEVAYFETIPQSILSIISNHDTIRFTGTSRALVSGYLQRECSVTPAGSDLILTRFDTTSGFTQGNEKTRHISYLAGRVKPHIISESLQSSTGGNYVFYQRFRDIIIVYASRDILFMPYIICNRSSKSVVYPEFSISNNYLDEDFYKTLPESDTVHLMEFSIEYRKKK